MTKSWQTICRPSTTTLSLDGSACRFSSGRRATQFVGVYGMERTEMVTAAGPQEQGFERLYLQAFQPVPTPEQVAAEIDGLIKLLKLGTCAPVLNLSCGPGQH